MRTGEFVSVEAYLAIVRQPDCEYLDGEIVDRWPAERDHRTVQGELLFLFHSRRERWNTFGNPRNKRAWTCMKKGNREVLDGVLRTDNPVIEIPLAEILAEA